MKFRKAYNKFPQIGKAEYDSKFNIDYNVCNILSRFCANGERI